MELDETLPPRIGSIVRSRAQSGEQPAAQGLNKTSPPIRLPFHAPTGFSRPNRHLIWHRHGCDDDLSVMVIGARLPQRSTTGASARSG